MYEVKGKKARLQILGSMGLRNDVVYPCGADLLVFPLQGRSDLDTFGLDIVARLKPKRVLLDHYDDAFAPATDQVKTEGFEKNVRELLGIPCRKAVAFEAVDIKGEES